MDARDWALVLSLAQPCALVVLYVMMVRRSIKRKGGE